jgi:signal transduction histidine kinase
VERKATSVERKPEFALVDERALRLLAWLPFAMLAIATALAAANDHGSSTKLLEDLGLAAVTGAWMAFIYALHPRWHERPRLMVGCYVVLLVLTAALVLRDPLFGFYSWTGYFWASVLFEAGPWARLCAYAPVAVITGTSQHGGLPDQSVSSWVTWVAFIAINLLAAGAISWFARAREEEHVRRKQIIDELTETNTRLEASLRENAGLRAQLLAQAREAGVLDERQRMAGEIHDTLAQGLVGIITQLEAAAEARPGEQRRRTNAAIELARESLAEARRSVEALAPAPLARAGLPEALRAVAAKWSERSAVTATIAVTGEPRPVRQEIENALLRTAQEALANVGKHAAAHKVVVTLSYMDDVVTLDVRDDGIGFLSSPLSLRNGGFGLTAMRRRIEGLAGTLEVESELGAGTTIAATIPLVSTGAPTGSHSAA